MGQSILFPYIFGVGYDGVEQALLGNLALVTLGILLVLKILATSLTLGAGGSGGVFAPSLFIGAMFGGVFGDLANRLLPGSVAPPGAYSLVGMAAVFSGAARAPITAIIIVFEMTRNYAIYSAGHDSSGGEHIYCAAAEPRKHLYY